MCHDKFNRETKPGCLIGCQVVLYTYDLDLSRASWHVEVN